MSERVPAFRYLWLAATFVTFSFFLPDVLAYLPPDDLRDLPQRASGHPIGKEYSNEWLDCSGKKQDREQLKLILGKHKRWLASGMKSGSPADLAGARLTNIDLAELEFNHAFLNADMSGSRLDQAKIARADLGAHPGAGLQLGVRMGSFDLPTVTTLGGASEPEWSRAWSCPRGRYPRRAASLQGVSLVGTDLSDSYLGQVDFQSSVFSGAKLDRARLAWANLTNAQVNDSSFAHADLSGVALDFATIVRTDMSGTNLRNASLYRTIFEPGTLPDVTSMANARYLAFLTYNENPFPLISLRKEFRDRGFRESEREITYALNRRKDLGLWLECTMAPGGYWSCWEYMFRKIFFDWTSQYGWSPGRSLLLGVYIWGLCSLAYLGFLHWSGASGLYRAHVKLGELKKDFDRVHLRAVGEARGFRQLLRDASREWEGLRVAMFFSAISALNIGFKGFDFGRWLKLLTRQEFDMAAKGWARVVSGWQSLITVFLITLWLLTYFGRPFE